VRLRLCCRVFDSMKGRMENGELWRGEERKADCGVLVGFFGLGSLAWDWNTRRSGVLVHE
jgi:hypothetical protein